MFIKEIRGHLPPNHVTKRPDHTLRRTTWLLVQQPASPSFIADRFHFTSRALSLPTEHCERSVLSSLVPSNAVSRDMEGRKASALVLWE